MSESATPDLPLGTAVTITYTNWRGTTASRTIIPQRIWFGTTKWHPGTQWLLTAYDIAKQAERDFAIHDISAWNELALEDDTDTTEGDV